MNALTTYFDAFLRTTCAWLMRPMATQVLRCNPSSISFSREADQPQISCPDTLHALQSAIKELVDLKHCVAFPTETVYGLGALALDGTAASKIFTTKGRPADNPLIVHISGERMLSSLLPAGYTPPRAYRALTSRLWPGPLTLLFPADRALVPHEVTADHATVGVRVPAHPVARALIALAGAPLAAPSANASGRPSPTRADHVLHDLQGRIALILDGGPCDVGVESTVVDGLLEDGNLRVLRPGGVTVEQMEEVLREEWARDGEGARPPKVLVHRRDYADEAIERAPTTPGMKYRHYSPTVPVMLMLTSARGPEGAEPTKFADFIRTLQDGRAASDIPRKVGLMAPSDSSLAKQLLNARAPGIQWLAHHLGPLANPSITAQRLFDGLLALDQAGVDLILIEEIAEEREGLAVMNRVRKAASDTIWITA